MSKAIYLYVISAGVVFSSLAGCGNQGDEEGAANRNQPDPVRFPMEEEMEDEIGDIEEFDDAEEFDKDLFQEEWDQWPEEGGEDAEAENDQDSTEDEEGDNEGSAGGNGMIGEVVTLTNEEREQQGLPALELDNELSEVADAKSEDMSENDYFAHESPTYGAPAEMMDEFGVDYTISAENIARGQRSAQQVVEGWMNSEGHRENILNEEVTHIGVGYDEDGRYWTQMFIKK